MTSYRLRTCSILFGATLALVSAITMSAGAIQTTGEPGSPSATTTISGKQLPAPNPKFGGVIKETALESKPWWAPRIVPPRRFSTGSHRAAAPCPYR